MIKTCGLNETHSATIDLIYQIGPQRRQRRRLGLINCLGNFTQSSLKFLYLINLLYIFLFFTYSVAAETCMRIGSGQGTVESVNQLSHTSWGMSSKHCYQLFFVISASTCFIHFYAENCNAQIR